MHKSWVPPLVAVPFVRVRITKRLTGQVDGVRLDHFEPRYVYEVGVLIGCYLLAIGAAEPVDDEGPAVVLPITQQLFGPPPLRLESRRTTSSRVPLAAAAEKPRRTRKRRSKHS
jgi:hypothetical protein